MSSASSNAGLTADEQQLIDAYWRAANYLSVGQIYLLDNPLLQRPLVAEDVKPRLLGHWGTTPGLNFVYAHLNRLIRRHDVDVVFMAGPGHGGPGARSQRLPGRHLLGGVPAHHLRRGGDAQAVPPVLLSRRHSEPRRTGDPRVDPRGRRTGYVLSHAYGAAFDNPQLIVAAVVGDGEAETGPLAASWHSNKFLDPVHDGAVLPILHLNGYKIANPTVLARIPREELIALLTGYGHQVITVEGDDPAVAARGDGRGHGTGLETHQGDPERRPRGRGDRAPAMADDSAGHPEGLDRAENDRRAPVRGHLAVAPGTADRHPGQRRAPRDARDLDAVLST